MNHIRTYRLFIVFIMVIFPIPAFSQSEKVDVEIHIADKDAYIYLDGGTNSIGHGRTLYNIQLTQGKHTVTATRPSYSKVSKTVTISNSNFASRIIKLGSPQPIYGHIFVDSKPSSLEIYLDGVRTNQFTPYTFDSILIGTHSISLAYTGYKDYKRSVNVLESDTAGVYAVLEENKTLKPTEYTTTYSGHNSGYSSSRSSYNSSSSTSSSYSRNYSTSSLENKEDHDWRMMYFGLGGSVGTNFSAHLSFFNVRYKYIELRPFVWGVSYSILKNLPHHKLPANTLVHKEWTSSRYHYDGYYETAEPTRGAQWFYTPTIRAHIPLSGHYERAIVLGIGPQISWTKIKWKQEEKRLDWIDSYEFTNSPFPPDMYYFDGAWFTAEVAYNMQFSDHTEFEVYLRYQDGFVFGMEVKFGKSY